MNKFSTLSIRNKTIALIIIMTIIPFGFMLYSLTTERSRQVHEAINESAIHAEQTSKLISQITGSTELLLNMLSRLPIVQAGDEKTVNSFLLDLVAQYPQFSSIFVVDKSGQRWATTNQMTGTVSYSDRKYFKYALSSGKFSSGEYAIGKVKKKPVFSFGLPVRDSSGAITGVAVATLELSGIKESLLKHSSEDRMSVIVMDHLGKILIHSTRALLEGAPEQDAVFRRILQGPEAATMEAEREQGASSRIMAYKKLYLPGEVSPYMYVLVESDKKLLMAEPNRKFGLNLTILLAAMLVSLFVAYRFSKRFVIDKVDESEQRFRSFVENTNDLIYTLSPAGIFTYVAPNVESLLGYLPDELIGKSFELFIHHEEIRSCRIFLQRLIETGTKQSGLECRILHKNGNWLWFISNASPVTDNTGCPAFLGIGRDITERKQVEEERRSMELQMQQAQKLESLGVLAGGIAHDFNNILMAIMGNADLALMRLNPESPAVDNLKRIEQSAARAADLAKQMLAYSGKGKFVVEHLDMSRLVEEMLHMMEVSISKKAELRLNLTTPLPSVEADATQLRQIIMNLIINASEAIGEHSGVIAIKTGCMECDRTYLQSIWLNENLPAGLYISLEVSDTGCGMDADTLAKLFDPFFTTKFTGRGLGMAAVLGIVRGHKGAIRVYSEPGKGSSFNILLPASSDRMVFGA